MNTSANRKSSQNQHSCIAIANAPGSTTRRRTTFSLIVPYFGVKVPLAPVDRYPPIDASDPGSIVSM
jgi:hypothetical protein